MPITSVSKDPAALTMTVVAEFPVPVQRLWDAYADPRQLEQAVDQATHPRAGIADARELFASRRIQRVAGLPFELRGEPVDRAQRRAQVVRHPVRERFQPAVRGLQFGGALAHALLQGFVQLAQLALGRTLGGDLAELRNEVQRRTIRGAHQRGVEQHVDGRAIPAQVTLLGIQRGDLAAVQALEQAFGQRQVVGMAERMHAAADQFRRRTIEHPAQRGIHVHPAAVQRNDGHADARRGHGQAEAGIVLLGDRWRWRRHGRPLDEI